MSICNDCRTMCAWMTDEVPVPGWTAKPSANWPGGWSVRKCPLFVKLEDDVKLKPSAVYRGRKKRGRIEK